MDRGVRLDGIDAARALALIGMLMVHFGPEDGETLAGMIYGFPHGRASILFAVVAGVGMSLLAGGRLGIGAARLRLLCYGAILLPLGLVMQRLDHPVAVILHHYAAFFVFGACILGLSRGALGAIAATMTLLGPAVYLAGRMSWPKLFNRSSVELGDAPLDILAGLVISGPYPLLVWSAPILWGMWLGRFELRERLMAPAMLAGGCAVAAVALGLSAAGMAILGDDPAKDHWSFYLTAAAHSEMPLWIAQSVGFAIAAIGLCLLLARAVPMLVMPVAMLGAMTLSVYVAHLLALSYWPDFWAKGEVRQASSSVLIFVAGAMAFAVCWRPVGRGPLELVLHRTWLAISGLVPEPRAPLVTQCDR